MNKETVNITIDGQNLDVPKGIMILEAARLAHIKIPTLCHHEDQAVKSNCRICVVEIEGMHLLQAACSYPVAAGMVIHTANPKIRKVRKNILELILAHHPQDCLVCGKNEHCELRQLTAELNIDTNMRYDLKIRDNRYDTSSPAIVRDTAKCILCNRCVEACDAVQSVSVLTKENRGFHTVVVPPYNRHLVDTACVSCGQCVQVCPVGALTIKDETQILLDRMAAGKTVVAQIAPSVRFTLAEALGEEVGTISTGRIVAAMKRIGFDKVFDTNFSADLTIMEEGHELLQRINGGGTLPMITSCCPGWVKFCETFYPQETKHLSTAKSPQQMFGAIMKTYYAQKAGLDPANLYSVSIMPCTAKKFECTRREMYDSGFQDVDLALTVQELAALIRSAGIQFAELAEEDFDQPFGLGSGAGAIFAATGGVMEAALRTLYEVLTGTELKELEFAEVRGLAGVKEAGVEVNGQTIQVAVVHGLSNARKIMEAVQAGKAAYHFIEVMACPGGCIGGGGNPIRNWQKVKSRTQSVYQLDTKLPIRKSHENPAIKELYQEFLGEPLSEKSHALLHTHYLNRQDLLR